MAGMDCGSKSVSRYSNDLEARRQVNVTKGTIQSNFIAYAMTSRTTTCPKMRLELRGALIQGKLNDGPPC